MRGYNRIYLACIILILFCASAGAQTYPVSWPTGAGDGTNKKWQAYTMLLNDIKDGTTASSGGDGDTTYGANPTGAQDISSMDPDRTYPSAYWSFDAANQVFFYRIRVAQNPLASGVKKDGIPDPVTNDIAGKPWANGTWNLTVEIDGDGWKEFAVILDGNSGGSSNDIEAENPPNFPNLTTIPIHAGDDIVLFYNNL